MKRIMTKGLDVFKHPDQIKYRPNGFSDVPVSEILRQASDPSELPLEKIREIYRLHRPIEAELNLEDQFVVGTSLEDFNERSKGKGDYFMDEERLRAILTEDGFYE
jgi:hypothetical protein